MKGHIGFVARRRIFAVFLNTGTSYTVPAGAVSVKAWAIGAGSMTGAGGVVYKTWPVSEGQVITYSVPLTGPGGASHVTVSGETITAAGALDNGGGGFIGGDGGAVGGSGGEPYAGVSYAGSINGVGIDYAAYFQANGLVPHPGVDVDGLFDALRMANASAGQGAAQFLDYGFSSAEYDATPGGGGFNMSTSGPASPGGGAVVLLFT